MNQPLSVTPNAAAPRPAGARSAKGAAEHAAPGTPDLAVLPLSDLLQLLHSTDTGLSASDAAAILKAVGPNRIDSAKPKGLLTAFIGTVQQSVGLDSAFRGGRIGVHRGRPELRHHRRHCAHVRDPRRDAGAPGPRRC